MVAIRRIMPAAKRVPAHLLKLLAACLVLLMLTGPAAAAIQVTEMADGSVRYDIESASTSGTGSFHEVAGDLVASAEPQIIGTHAVVGEDPDGSGGAEGVDYEILASIAPCDTPGRCYVVEDGNVALVEGPCVVHLKAYSGVLYVRDFDDGTWGIKFADELTKPAKYFTTGPHHNCW